MTTILYVAQFNSMSKVGITGDPIERYVALRCERGPMKIVRTWRHADPMLIEAIVKAMLRGHRVDFGREWFSLPASEVCKAVGSAIRLEASNDFLLFRIRDFGPSMRERVRNACPGPHTGRLERARRVAKDFMGDRISWRG